MVKKLIPFSNSDMEEALHVHADYMIGGHDNSDALLAQYAAIGNVLENLLNLARRVHDALLPVDPADVFVVELKARLSEVRGDEMAREERIRERRRAALKVAGVAGLLVSGVAMVALGVRFIIGMVSRRRATTTI